MFDPEWIAAGGATVLAPLGWLLRTVWQMRERIARADAERRQLAAEQLRIRGELRRLAEQQTRWLSLTEESASVPSRSALERSSMSQNPSGSAKPAELIRESLDPLRPAEPSMAPDEFSVAAAIAAGRPVTEVAQARIARGLEIGPLAESAVFDRLLEVAVEVLLSLTTGCLARRPAREVADRMRSLGRLGRYLVRHQTRRILRESPELARVPGAVAAITDAVLDAGEDLTPAEAIAFCEEVEQGVADYLLV